MYKIAIIFFLSIFLVGCATEYQPNSFTGGYTDQMTGPNTATVEFQGNGFINASKTKRHAMRRAAELTLERGFDYFLVESGGDYTKNVTIQPSVSCNTYGRNTSCYPVGGGSVSKPRTQLDIRMFNGKTPNESGYYDARYLAS
jgi:hypothetical protein